MSRHINDDPSAEPNELASVLHSLEEVPTCCNTGVVNAAVLIDYLAFTVREPSSFAVLIEGLRGAGRWQPTRGGYGYRTSLRNGGIRIFNDGNPGMGFHVRISGEGCRQLEHAGIIENWPQFLASLHDELATITRLDVALDDYDGLLPLEEMVACVRAGEVCSRQRSRRIETNCDERGRGGQTIYVGSKSSDTKLRIYDKAAEQEMTCHWVRVELETRKKYAVVLSQSIASSGLHVVPSMVRNLVDFKHQGTGQKCRWPSRSWWSTFLGKCEKARLMLKRPPTTDASQMAWFYLITPVLAAIRDQLGHLEFNRVLDEARSKASGAEPKSPGDSTFSNT